MNVRQVARLFALGAGLVGLGVIAWLWGREWVAFFRDQGRLQAWMTSLGAWGPLASVALNVAQVLIAPIPGQSLNMANGYLFGLWRGTLYSMAGVSLGSWLAMGLARRGGRAWVTRWVEPTQLARLDGWAARRGALFFFIVFLLPFVPDDLACFAVGLSRLSIPRMMILALVARFPGVLSSVWIGAHATTLSLVGWAGLMAGAALLGLAAWRWMSGH